MKKYSVVVIFCVTILPSAWASQPSYYDQHAIGWHWYHEISNQEKNKKKTAPDPIQQVNALHLAVQNALDQAILNPTSSNVTQYIVLQNQVSALSSRFAQVWQRVLLEQPNLHYSLTHPTNSLGRQIYLDEESRKLEAIMQRFAKQYGLFFFYRSTCPYCHEFAPIIKRLSEEYQISVIPVSIDGEALPEFPHSQFDKGQAVKLHITIVPALFAVNPTTQRIIPIAYGLLSETDLKKRIANIATDFRGIEGD